MSALNIERQSGGEGTREVAEVTGLSPLLSPPMGFQCTDPRGATFG